MQTFEIRAPDGTIYEVQAESVEGANRAFRDMMGEPEYVQPEPPEGVIIHEADQSRVVGSDRAPRVDVSGAAPASMQPSGDGLQALMDRRQLASAGLESRRRSGDALASITPFFAGQTLSWGDDGVSSAVGAAGGDGRLAQEIMDQQLAQQREDHPIRSTVSQIGGALTMAPYVAAGATKTGAASLPLVGRMLTGGAAGAGLGAVDGAGDAGEGNRTDGAIRGGAFGGGIGLLGPVVGAAGRRIGQRVLDNRSVDSALRRVGLRRDAATPVMQALDADDALSPEAAARVFRAGDDAMLADAGGATVGLLDSALQGGGAAVRIARQNINKRMSTASRRLNSALDATLGKPQGAATATRQVREASAQARKQAYDRAYAQPIDYSLPEGREVESLLSRVPRRAINRANELMRTEGARSPQILVDIGQDGVVQYRSMPDVRQVDYITRAMQDIIDSQDGRGVMGGTTDFGRAVTGLKSQLRSRMRRLVPEYGQALDTAADPASEAAAIRLGTRALSRATPRDELAENVANMSRAELRGLRQGVRSAIDEQLANVRAMAGNPDTETREIVSALQGLNSRAARDKMTTILGERQANVLFQELDRASQAVALSHGIARNSATAGRLAMQGAKEQANAPGVLESLASGEIKQAGQRIPQQLFGRTPEDALRRNRAMDEQIASILTSRRGEDARGTLRELLNAYRAMPENERRAFLADRAISSGIVTSGPAATSPERRAGQN